MRPTLFHSISLTTLEMPGKPKPEIELIGGKEISDDQFASLASEILAMGRSVRFRVRGGSMRPFIQDGDLLEIQPVRSNDIRLGDILLYHFGCQQLLVHRVVRVQKDVLLKGGLTSRCFVIQGDAAQRPDGCIKPEFVLGRVTSVEHAGHTRSLDNSFQRVLAVVYVFGLSGVKFVYRKLGRSV